ncbi:alpha/beta hydrolase [Antribacter sp. KLBMP9083]|uniref:Alpha/beta hydrolase n=1 Tax=Antribacter soli TaxID=2910976 RepID=A0AA41U732_9MICO|nr:alpha/beta hydrolase [Antribacter soli]MCF4121111.1 alpha/beta hydrolase [Antribacter soli]
MSQQGTAQGYAEAPTRTVAAAGALFAYRELGPQTGTALVLLTHLGANLDGWDPRIVDGLAQDHRVIAVDYRGVGGSTGRVRSSMEEMADDVVALLGALGHDRVDMLGLAVGGMVAQAVAARAPRLIARLILASTGPAGGPGLAAMTGTAITTGLRAALTLNDPKTPLFFTSTATGKSAARAYLARLKERTTGRDKAVSPGTYHAQLTAIRRWGLQAPAELSAAVGRVLIVHGDSDRLVPPANATELARLLPAATVTVYPDSGHGAVFQYHREFVDAARDFLHR